MSQWLISLQGTPEGHVLAVALALLAAFSHAAFGALQKGRHDPWLSRGAIDLSYALIAAPFALFVVPWPEPHMWPILAVTFLIHVGYKLAQARTYVLGSYTVVYPVVRGTGPLFAVIGATIFFGERYTAAQWLGVAVLLAGIYGLAAYNLRHWQAGRARLRPALAMAVLTGLFVALYTAWDAYAIRSAADPFTFLAWFFLIDGLFMPTLAALRLGRMTHRPAPGPLIARGITGAFIALISFGSIMLATRIDAVGQAAVLRETSTVFAALIGWLMLGERVGGLRLLLMGLIAAGAVIVEIGA